MGKNTLSSSCPIRKLKKFFKLKVPLMSKRITLKAIKLLPKAITLKVDRASIS